MNHRLLSLLLSLFLVSGLSAQPIVPSTILNERERARVVDEILEDRFDNLLPQLMRREGIDMWVIIAREYNEDPVLKTMLPSTWLSARRRTIIVFFDLGPEKGLEKLAIAGMTSEICSKEPGISTCDPINGKHSQKLFRIGSRRKSD
jgi:hypothetical protein